MSRVLIVGLVTASTGCTVNIYWTDHVVHGQLYLGAEHIGQREPIPLELKGR